MAKEIGSLNVKIGLDASGFQNGIASLNREMRVVQSEFKASTATLGDHGKGLEGLKLKSDSLTRQTEIQKQKVEALEGAHKKSMESKGQDAKATQDLEIKLNKARAQLSYMEKDLSGINKEIDVQSSGWYKLGQALKPVGQKMQDIGKGMESVGKDLSTKVTLPIAGFGAAAVKIGMDFEQSMSKVKAMSGATGDEMVLLEQAARDAGATTSKSAKDAADALGYMALAGWDTSTSIEGLMPVLRLSEAGNIDLAKASSLVTDSMSALGLTTADLPGYLDIVAQTARSSNTDIDQMAEAYLKVGGTLRGLGVPLEESALALGLLANSGIKGSEAGTALNAVMANLTAPTGRAKDALEELGFSAFDSSGNFKGLENVLFELKDKLAGMSEEQKSTYLAMIGGKEHVKDLNALLNGLDDSYEDLTMSIKDSEGALEDVAKTMQDNNKGSLTELSSALEELGLKIYDILKPSIAAIVESIQGFVDKLNSLSPAQQEAIVKIGLLVAAIGPVLIILGKLVAFIGSVVSAFSAISGAVAAAGGAMAILTGPVGIAIAVIGALVAAGVALYKNWDTIKEWASNVWEGIKDMMSGVAESIMNIWEGVKVGIAFVWEVIKSIFESAWLVISTIVQTYINIVTAVIEVAWQVIQTVTTLVWETISGVITGVWEAIVNFMTPIIEVISNMISTAWETIKTVTETVFNLVSELISTVWTGIVDFISPIIDVIVNVVTTAWNGLQIVTTTVMNVIKTVITTIWNAIKTVTMTVWNGISSFFTTIWDGITTIFTTTVNGIQTTISNVWNSIKTVTSTVWNGIKTAIMTPIKAAAEFVKKQLDKIKGFFDKLKLKFPKIKLPHFSIKGSFSLSPPSVPKLGVDWYAKGGIFNSPSIIGVGEAGQEAVLPIDRLDDLMARAIEKVGGQVGGSGGGLTVLIENFNNHTDKDIEQLAYELEFYRQRVAFGRGRGNA